ncbi:MAG: hypothetical protein WB992_13840 [Bryobacteraceae bacterium]
MLSGMLANHETIADQVCSPQLVKIPSSPAAEMRLKMPSSLLKSHRKKVISASICGIAFGLVVAALGSPAVDVRIHKPQHALIIPAARIQVLRLETRNRRLEALVEVLKRRARQHPALEASR